LVGVFMEMLRKVSWRFVAHISPWCWEWPRL